jgi:uncharacterized protein YggE
MNRNGVAWIVVMMLCAMAASPANAGDADGRVVSASGESTITAPPEILRVAVLLKVEGKDIKEALLKLSQDKQSAKEKLARLNVPADAIKFTDPAMGERPLTPQQRQMQMYMQQRNGGAVKKPTTAPTPVTVTATMSADIALKTANDEEMLLAVADLQAKLRDAFKPIVQRAKTPEEQEVLEEMQGAEQAASGEIKPGEPAFAYVHLVTEAEQNTAMADAFAQAKRSAERLAKAAGADLGELKTLNANISNGSPAEGGEGQPIYYGAMMGAGGMPGSNSTGTIEATGAQPGPVSSRVTVNVGFGLKP